MRDRLIPIAVCLLAIVFATQTQTVGASGEPSRPLWVAESNGVLKLRAPDGEIVLEIPRDDISALTVDSVNGDVWAYGRQRLLRYDPDGQIKLDAAIDGNLIVTEMVVDSTRQQVWLAGAYALSRYSFEGQFISQRVFPSLLRGLSPDPVRANVWAATLNALYVFDANGTE